MTIYKACDIRGIYPKEFTDDTAYRIGRAVGTKYQGRALAVGGDVRISTPALKQRLIDGLLDSGADVVDIGLAATPVFYYALSHLTVSGGITVTASHNPPQYNGFKMMFGEIPVDEAFIHEIRDIAENGGFSVGHGTMTVADILPAYKESMRKLELEGTLKVVIDAGNGSMSTLAPEVFQALGFEVIPLYCWPDGNFPFRDPNPAVYENLTDLSREVLAKGADFGMAFDGDGDRVVFADNKGSIIKSEKSLVLFIRHYLAGRQSSVVYDQKSSSIVRDAVIALNGRPIMERSGHAFIKKRFLENHSALAGEISGHFFFGELGYDDGLYAALKMAQIIRESGLALSSLLADIPGSLITPDIRIPCPYAQQDAWLDRVRTLRTKGALVEIDGVRIEYASGWLLVRRSVTEESMTVRIEAKDQQAMDGIKADLLSVLPEISEAMK